MLTPTVVKNIKIVLLALAVALWYNASGRLYDVLFPKRDLRTAVLMFAVASLILLWRDNSIAEILFDLRSSNLFPEFPQKDQTP